MDKANGDAPFIPLYGTAVPGAGLGRLAGLPAAGLRLHRGQAAPEPGVYAAEILLGGRRLCGLAHIAPGGGAPSIELLFFHGGEAPCGEAVELRLRQRLRRCQPFDNLPLLSAQLRLDCLSAQSFWGISPGSPRLSMESAGRRAVVGMQAIPLSEKEFGVLYLLYTHPDVPSQKSRSMRPFGARRPTTASTPWRTPCFRSGGGSAPMRAGTTLSAPLSGSAISSIPAEPPLCAAAGTKALGKWEKIWYPKALSHFEGAFMKQRTFPILAVLLLAAALSGCQSTAAGDSAGLSIHFIDPGQTSSALLLCGGQAMLIDGGSAERGSQVAGYLSQQGITYLDYVVCTSADETHIGGLSGPLYTCAVGQVLSPVEDAGSPVFADFRRYTEAQGLSPAVPEAGSVFPLGDAQVTVVETDAAAQTLSLQVDYGDTSLQFTSDLEDAVAAVASEAEGELPLGALVAGSDGTQFFLLDPVQTAP